MFLVESPMSDEAKARGCILNGMVGRAISLPSELLSLQSDEKGTTGTNDTDGGVVGKAEETPLSFFKIVSDYLSLRVEGFLLICAYGT